jgi:hypothetical protein
LCATSGPGARRCHRRCSIATRRIARASTRRRCWVLARAFCMPTGMPGSKGSTGQPRPTASHRWSRLHAGAIIWSRFLCGVAARRHRVGRRRQLAGLRIIFAFAWHAADAWGSASADPAPNFVERRCVRQEPGMARRSIVWLPLASIGRLFICASWQLRPGDATRRADCSVVLP